MTISLPQLTTEQVTLLFTEGVRFTAEYQTAWGVSFVNKSIREQRAIVQSLITDRDFTKTDICSLTGMVHLRAAHRVMSEYFPERLQLMGLGKFDSIELPLTDAECRVLELRDLHASISRTILIIESNISKGVVSKEESEHAKVTAALAKVEAEIESLTVTEAPAPVVDIPLFGRKGGDNCATLVVSALTTQSAATTRTFTVPVVANFVPALDCIDKSGRTECTAAGCCKVCAERSGVSTHISVVAATRPSKVEELTAEVKTLTVRQIKARRTELEKNAAICAESITTLPAGLADWAKPNYIAVRERVLSHYNAMIFVYHNELVSRSKAEGCAEPPAKRFKIVEGTHFYGDPFCDLNCNGNICCESCHTVNESFNKPLPPASRPTPKWVMPVPLTADEEAYLNQQLNDYEHGMHLEGGDF